MTIDPKLLARALRAAADVLDPSTGADARPNTNRTPARASAREAFAARFGGKSCEECRQAIERGAMVFWGHERGQLRHAECAGASASAPAPDAPANAPAPRGDPPSEARTYDSPAERDYEPSSFDNASNDEIPF